jgi:hypothetical protein
MALFLVAVLLGACGNSNKKSTSPAAAVPLGSATMAGINVCAICHLSVIADWMTSKHANALEGLDSSGSPTFGLVQAGGPGCIACHDPNGDSSKLTPGYTGTVDALGNLIKRPVIGCEACHGPGSLHADAGGVGAISLLSGTYTSTSIGPVPVSGQFVMCTHCHELLDATGTTTNPSPAHLTTAPTGTPYFITDTHFATPGHWPAPDYKSDKAITGYAMDFVDERVCSLCHNPHKAATQNREWARSAHADMNPINLNAAIPPTLPIGYFSGAWAHYNWSCDGTSGLACGPTDTSTSTSSPKAADRRQCQRCHTTSGFSQYADALRTGNSQSASDMRNGLVSLVTYTSNFKPEMLMCNGCHTDNRGNLRNPGGITANYDYVSGGVTYAKASHTYPDVAGSNICMTCHTGREIGDTIKGLNDPALLSAGTITTFDFSNKGFINSHYLTAGGQIFTVTGYEFDNRPYNNISGYRHDIIGTPATQQLAFFVNTGSNGPCIGCHMSRPNKNGDHLFLPVSRSTTTIGLVTGIASEVCFNCHGSSPQIILDMVNVEKQQFLRAMEALKDQLLLQRGYNFAPFSPYFFTAPYDPAYDEPIASPHCQKNLAIENWQTGGTTASFTWNTSKLTCDSTLGTPGIAGTGKNNMGSAFNFNLLEHDPGAYVHNRLYVKRLIYDSLDWLDDGVMNYSVGTTLNTLCSNSPPSYCVEAMTYLLPSGVLGIEAERP